MRSPGPSRFRLRTLVALVAGCGVLFGVARMLARNGGMIPHAAAGGSAFLIGLALARRRGPIGGRGGRVTIAIAATIAAACTGWACYRFTWDFLLDDGLAPDWWITPDRPLWALHGWLVARDPALPFATRFDGSISTVQWICGGLNAASCGIMGLCFGRLSPPRRPPAELER